MLDKLKSVYPQILEQEGLVITESPSGNMLTLSVDSLSTTFVIFKDQKGVHVSTCKAMTAENISEMTLYLSQMEIVLTVLDK